MSKWIVVAVVLWVFTPMLVLAQQVVSKCEDQLRLSNNLINQFASDRTRVQVELAQTIIALENAQKELDAMKKAAISEPKK